MLKEGDIMENKKFKTESNRLMDLMINSIYTNKEIFLREIISNASDAMDKMYYIALTDDKINFNKDDYYIRISPDKENRTIRISDHGIGMDKKELEDNLGTIAKSGSLDFKYNNSKDKDDNHQIIGQFGVGFYSAFMVAKKIEVLTKSYKSDKAYLWVSEEAKDYNISESKKDDFGTIITLSLKDNTDDENYDEFLDEYKIKSLVKRYSNYIRYPIKMLVEKTKPSKDSTDENPKFETYKEDEVLNSMVPLWRKNKNELKEEDYDNFYNERHYGYDKPLSYLHLNLEGNVSFKAVLYIPSQRPFDFFNVDRKKGLELYSNGVMIMENCEELLPDYLSFVKGVCDSEDISLNISREMLQNTRELRLIRRSIEKKVFEKLKRLFKDKREDYIKFFQNFGVILKSGAYANFGQDADKLKDFLIYKTTKRDYISLEEYIKDMKPDQKYIYYATGESVDQIKELPQIKSIMDKDYEVLLFDDPIDEFVVKVLRTYGEKEFKSISQAEESSDKDKDESNEDSKLLSSMKDILKDEVVDVKENKNLTTDAAFLSSQGEISIDMEKTLAHMPGQEGFKAEKVLEINPKHVAFKKLKDFSENDKDKFKLYTELLYNSARLIAGLEINDPVEFSRNIAKLL